MFPSPSTSSPAPQHPFSLQSWGSVESASNSALSNTPETNPGKRGRPRADLITHLMLEGSSSPSEIKCRVCNRVFPREKSLQAHLRTHTGERPYACDYPGCSRAFTQSGQLKTHQRLHAGEKPFLCSAPNCTNRYTHANRTCPLHPLHKPKRTNDIVLQPALSDRDNEQVLRWLEKYRQERLERTPAKVGANAKDGLALSCQVENTNNNEIKDNLEPTKHIFYTPAKLGSGREVTNIALVHKTTPVRRSEHVFLACGTPTSSPVADEQQPWMRATVKKRVLVRELEQQENLGPKVVSSPSLFNVAEKRESVVVLQGQQQIQRLPLSPIRRTLGDITPQNSLPNNSANSSLKPKKRWLKEVFEEQKKRLRRDEEEDDDEPLAKPISWSNNNEDENVLLGINAPSSAFMLAASALMELGDATKIKQPRINCSDQPLNLSLNTSQTGA